ALSGLHRLRRPGKRPRYRAKTLHRRAINFHNLVVSRLNKAQRIWVKLS
ncbi:hypothetical protein LTSEUGA_5162, partial [Salmonella enterica subsp. enterica serovar Uganda str. R8-3404]